MKILVAIKRVIDPYVRIRVKADHTAVETANVKMSINPFDEIAIEAAVRLKEAGIASEIIVVSIGSIATQENLRSALALGADRAKLIETDQPDLEPINIAKLLRAVAIQESVQLVLLGKQTIDGDNNQTGQMLAGLLNWSQATFSSDIKIEDTTYALVTREIDGGLETIEVKLPAVLTTDLRLNTPRYASLPNIMKAKQKPLETIALASLGIDLKSHTSTLSVMPPAEREAGMKVENAQDLVHKLRFEAKVI